MTYNSREEKRYVNEKMSAVLIPMMNYCDDDTKNCIQKTLEILSNTKIGNKTETDKVIEALDNLKKNEPETEITMETPKGCLTLKIKDALVYEAMGGGIVMDSE